MKHPSPNNRKIWFLLTFIDFWTFSWNLRTFKYLNCTTQKCWTFMGFKDPYEPCLGILSTSFMRYSPRMLFQQSLKSFHICWALVGCLSFTLRSNSSQRISIGLRSGDCGGQVIWCSIHYSSSWSNSPYIAWRCVLDHCPVEKQMTFPRSANQMGWRIAAECCGSHAG